LAAKQFRHKIIIDNRTSVFTAISTTLSSFVAYDGPYDSEIGHDINKAWFYFFSFLRLIRMMPSLSVSINELTIEEKAERAK
jgi:hypothetical protein